eukprot:Pgem_evm1s15713
MDGDQKRKNAMQMAKVYEKLKIDIPNFFRKKLQYEMYSEDIEFQENVSSFEFHTHKKRWY